MSDASLSARRLRVELQSQRPLSPGVVELRLRAREAFTWSAGQYLELAVPDAPGPAVPYSLASAPRPDAPGLFELALSRSGNGELLASLAVGMELEVSEPRGSFRWSAHDGATLLVGINTGVAPLRAMVEAAVAARGADPIVLLCGARAEADILWRDEFEALAARDARFRFAPTLSQSGADWRGLRGRVHAHLASVVRPLREVRAYLCGSRAMVEECSERLIADARVPRERIQSEAF